MYEFQYDKQKKKYTPLHEFFLRLALGPFSFQATRIFPGGSYRP